MVSREDPSCALLPSKHFPTLRLFNLVALCGYLTPCAPLDTDCPLPPDASNRRCVNSATPVRSCDATTGVVSQYNIMPTSTKCRDKVASDQCDLDEYCVGTTAPTCDSHDRSNPMLTSHSSGVAAEVFPRWNSLVYTSSFDATSYDHEGAATWSGFTSKCGGVSVSPRKKFYFVYSTTRRECDTAQVSR